MARAYDEEADQPAGDVLHEACGITGIYACDADVARLTYFGLYALQHRGQESAGIAVGDGGTIESHREMGLIGGIFDEEILAELTGYIGVGHTRYSTSGSSVVVNAQPFIEDDRDRRFRLRAQRQSHQHRRRCCEAPAARARARRHLGFRDPRQDDRRGARHDARERIKARDAVAPKARIRSCCATPDAIYAFRDPWGVRPLCLGRTATAAT